MNKIRHYACRFRFRKSIPIRLGSKSSLRQSQIAYLKFIGNVYKQKNMKVNHTMKTTNVLFTTICSTFLI